MSVRLRITLVAALLATLAIGASAAILVTILRGSLIDAADDSSRARAAELLLAHDEDKLENPITDIAEEGVAQIVEDDGKIPAASANLTGKPRISSVVPRVGQPVRLFLRNAPDEDETENYRVWAVRGDDVTAYVGTSLESEREILFNLARYLIIGLPLLVALLALGTWFMVGRTLRPVEDIRTEVSAISHRRLDRRVPVPGTKDEIGRLARTMNEMLGRLETASQKQRDFVGNASHELRSPLAAFRTQLEVAAAHPEGADWPMVATDLLRDSDRMERLVQDLLFLAREDEQVVQPSTPLDFDDVVLEEVTRLRSTSRVEVNTEDVSGAPMRGRRDDLARLVRNLLDNASAYATSRVDVSLQATGDEVVLTVSDDGPGIAPEDRPRIFERFYRADPSRNRQTMGTGLGLAIVEAVAAEHGGTVELANTETGARFVVTLPTMDSDHPADSMPVPS